MQILNSLVSVGQKIPPFSVKGNKDKDAPVSMAFFDVTNLTIKEQYSVFVFYPADFTFICPTELVQFGDLHEEFEALGAKVYGVSTDSEHVHLAWRNADEKIGGLPYSLLADTNHQFSSNLGVLNVDTGMATRATIITDKEGVVQYVAQTPDSVGRDANEILRVLQAIQEPGLCPASWAKGDDTLEIE